MTDVAKIETKPQTRAIAPIAVNDMGILKPANLSEAIEVAKLIAHSGFVPKIYEGNPGAVMVAIQMGSELGLSPMASLRSIAVINGRSAIYGDGMIALVASHPDCEDIVESLDEATMTATCTVKRRGRTPRTCKFSMADAKQAGLQGKQGPWSQYPKRMLQMRARGFALRDAFPDALSGIVSVEEARDYNVVDGEFVENKLEPGDHSFGFTPRTASRTVESPTAPVATEKPAPLTEKEKSWRGKKKNETYNPSTGEFPDSVQPAQLPTDEPQPEREPEEEP